MMTMARVALVSVTLVISALASAQGFPSRSIRMIVPYAPGGNVDISARIIGPGVALAVSRGGLVIVALAPNPDDRSHESPTYLVVYHIAR